MRGARTFCVLAVAAILSGCAANATSNRTPLKPQTAWWPTYQHSADRNAVFEHYSIPNDWSYDANSPINSGLALVGNSLLFTTFSHKVVALDVRNGRELWKAGVKNIAMSTPIVAGNMVYVGSGKSGELDRNLLQRVKFFRRAVWGVPGGDEVAAFDLRTGAARWRYNTVGEDMPSAVYDRGRLIFANGDWHAYALRADTGSPIWTTDVGGISTMANAALAGRSVIIDVCGRVTGTDTVALDASTGKILWRSSYGHCDATPAYADGKVFVNDVVPGDTQLQKRTIVAALDARTGKPVWVYRSAVQGLWSIVGSDEVAVAGTYAGGTYYQAAPLEDQLIAFDANTGKMRWRFHTAGPVKMSAVIRNGRVYFGDTAGMFYTLDARNGSVMELRSFKRPFSVSPPIIAGNKLLIVNGTSVNAIPVSGRPHIAERVGWGIIATMHDGESQ
jgi:outer membrane protein assembly factor BamB